MNVYGPAVSETYPETGALPVGSTLHSAGREGWIYVYLHCSHEDFRDFVLRYEGIGVVDADWIHTPKQRALDGALRPLGAWCNGRTRIYTHLRHYDRLVNCWQSFAAHREVLGVAV